VAPVFPAGGAEPLPPGWTEQGRVAMMQQKRVEGCMSMESCVVKVVMSGAGRLFILYKAYTYPSD